MAAPDRSYSLLSATLVFVVPGIADLLYGYDCGAVSYAILQLQDDELSGVPWGAEMLVGQPALRGTIISAAALGAFAASLFIFSIDTSRLRELQVGAVLYILGALLQVACSLFTHGNPAISCLILGRFIYGLGIGVSMHAAPAYLGEMAPTSIRGIFLSLKEAANTVGVLIGYQIGHTFSSRQGGWIYTFLISTLFAAASLAISLVLPKSTRWLLLNGKEQEAKNSLLFLYKDGSLAATICETIRRHLADRCETRMSETTLWDPVSRHALVTGAGIIALQQLTGSPAMLAYASTVFQEAGYASNSSVYMAMFQLFMTMIAVFLVEPWGRRILLFLGCGLMTVALIVLTISFGWYDEFVFVGMLAYIGGFQLGFGPIAWLIVSEVFSNELRSKATALCVQINFSTYGLVQFVFPVVATLVSYNGTFAIFALLSAYSIYFVCEYIPETKGMTLEDIEDKIESVHSQQSEFSTLAASNGKHGHKPISKFYGSITSTQEA